MPHVRVACAAIDRPDGSLSFVASAAVLDRLAHCDLAAGGAARRAIAALGKRLEAAGAAFGDRLAPFVAPPEKARLGGAYREALALACLGPTAQVSSAELAWLALLVQSASAPEVWQAHPSLRFGLGDRRLYGEVLEALARDEGEAADAPSLEAYFPPPAPAAAEGEAEAPPADPTTAPEGEPA